MPVEFLSDEQAAGFGRFAGELSRADLERFFYLDDADRDLIAVQVAWVLVIVATLTIYGSCNTDVHDTY